MGRTGIRNACRTVRMNVVIMVTAGKIFSAVIAHGFYVYALIAGRRIAVINPQEGTDFHFFLRLLQNLIPVSSHIDNLCRSQFMFITIAKIQIGKTFK